MGLRCCSGTEDLREGQSREGRTRGARKRVRTDNAAVECDFRCEVGEVE